MREYSSIKEQNQITRLTDGPLRSDESYGRNGAFRVRTPMSTLTVIASDGMGWEHVSVSVKNEKRCPTWEEMTFVKEIFWRPDEWVIEYHPSREAYVNNARYVLHLWKPIEVPIPHPPAWMVGSRSVGTLD